MEDKGEGEEQGTRAKDNAKGKGEGQGTRVRTVRQNWKGEKKMERTRQGEG